MQGTRPAAERRTDLSEGGLLEGIDEDSSELVQAAFPFHRKHGDARAYQLGEVVEQDETVAESRQGNVAD